MDQPGNNHLLLRASQSPPSAYNGQHAAADRMRELLARTVHDHLLEERSVAGALQEIRLRLETIDDASATGIAATVDGLAATPGRPGRHPWRARQQAHRPAGAARRAPRRPVRPGARDGRQAGEPVGQHRRGDGPGGRGRHRPASPRASPPWRTPYSRWPRRCSARRTPRPGRATEASRHSPEGSAPRDQPRELSSSEGKRGTTPRYSHSMVPGGLEVTSSTTRLTPGTSLVIRVEMRASTSYGQPGPVGGHRVLAGDRPQHDRVAVGAPVALHADRAHVGQQHHRALPDLAVQPGRGQLLAGDRVGLAQHVQPRPR